MKATGRSAGLAAAAFLAGCAGAMYKPMAVADRAIEQRILTERNSDYWAMLARLDGISWQVRRANRHLCTGKIAHEVGVRVADLGGYVRNEPLLHLPRDERGTYTVQSVTPGSPGHRDGIQPGDVLTKEELEGHARQEVCMGSVLLLRPRDVEAAGSLEAYTNGQQVALTTAVVEWLDTDDRIAAVVAHETAHIAMRHIDKRRNNAAAGAVLGAVTDGLLCGALGGLSCYTASNAGAGARAGAAAYSVDFEREADYVGMYMAFNAGFDTSVWSDLFLDIGVRFGQGFGSTHPSNPDRAASMVVWHENIQAEREAADARGLAEEPLFPKPNR